MKTKVLRALIIILSVIILILIDFAGKMFFSGPYQLMMPQCQYTFLVCTYDYFPLIGNWLGIQLSHNTGIAFGMPISGLPLQIITLVIIIGLIYYYIRYEYPRRDRMIDAGFTLIIAGALAHAYERIMIGHVVDFIAVKYFAILNFADIFISIGALLLIYASYVRKRHE